ncbi:TPA: two pore domain potassium channel family protein [Candidatus Woesearchaeota archaeon]|nr:two pore domain potassium channel family protein [Candidatus Woesearchaeota archaeon]
MPRHEKKSVKKGRHIPKAEVLAPKVASASTGFEQDKKDVSLVKLLNYNLLFFIPVLIAAIVSLKIGDYTKDFFMASPHIIAKILMIPFITVIFLLVVPFIRDREKIAGIRYSILAFFLVGIGITLPSMLQGHPSLFLQMFNYFGTYILVTFIYAPEVLGIERHLRDWFKHHKQLLIMAIYLSIVLLNVLGFGFLYHDIYEDAKDVTAFNMADGEKPGLWTFVYFSIVTFTTTGYGEITPASPAARLLFSMEAIYGLIINVLFIAILLVFVSNAEYLAQRKEKEDLKQAEMMIEKEEKELKKVEKEVEEVKKEEGFFEILLKKLFNK